MRPYPQDRPASTSRRQMLYGLGAAGFLLPGSRAWPLSTGRRRQGAAARARPSLQQEAWQRLELGMFVHFAPNTFQDLESDDLSTPLSAIDPVGLDTDQWARTAVAMGARYVVFVAKHQGGFCLWQTRTTDYSIRNTPWKQGKGDILADVAASCRRYGLKLGVYVCPRDDHFGAGTGGICKTPSLQRAYNAMFREQLTEVFSRYGDLVEIWFDGSTVTPVGDLLKKYQPNAMVFQGPQATIRWVGNEEGFAPYPCWNGIEAADARTGTATALDSDPNGDVWLPSEVDVSIRRPDWFWHTDNRNKVLTREQLLSIYYRSVGRGAQLLLNIPPNRQGLLPEPDVAAATELGNELKRRFGTPLASTDGTGKQIVLELPRAARVDTVILQEQIAGGERIRAYRLEGKSAGIWRSLAEGSAVGNKRLQPIAPSVISAIRFTATKSAGTPSLRLLAVFDTGTPPPQDWNAVSSVWAPNLIGTWTNSSFSFDLTHQITVAGLYILRFNPEQGAVQRLSEVVLELNGLPTQGLVKISPGRQDELQLDITGLDRTIRIHGRVHGAASGSVLLKRS